MWDYYADVRGETLSDKPIVRETSPSFDAIESGMEMLPWAGPWTDPYISKEITVKKEPGEIIDLNVYGVGFVPTGNITLKDVQRMIRPLGESVIIDTVIPHLEVMMGVKSPKGLDMYYGENPGKKLIWKIMKEFIDKPSTYTDLYVAIRDGNINKGVGSFTKALKSNVITTLENNPGMSEAFIRYYGGRASAKFISWIIAPVAFVLEAVNTTEYIVNAAWNFTTLKLSSIKTTFQLSQALDNPTVSKKSGIYSSGTEIVISHIDPSVDYELVITPRYRTDLKQYFMIGDNNYQMGGPEITIGGGGVDVPHLSIKK